MGLKRAITITIDERWFGGWVAIFPEDWVADEDGLCPPSEFALNWIPDETCFSVNLMGFEGRPLLLRARKGTPPYCEAFQCQLGFVEQPMSITIPFIPDTPYENLRSLPTS